MEVRLCAGYARSLDAQSRSIPISDRFFFDNATFVSKLVRGYPKTKLGPSDADYALGGSAYVLGGVHLFSRLPLLPRNAITDRLRIHGFVNAGSLIDCPSREIYYYSHNVNFVISVRSGQLPSLFSQEPKDIYYELLQKRKASYGLGIAMNMLNFARVEINYCFPVTDRTAP